MVLERRQRRAPRHVSGRPGRQRIRVTDPAEGVDQPRQPTEPQASQAARLKAADDGLVDSGQLRQLSLRESDPLPPTANQSADPSVSARRPGVGVLPIEGSPGHHQIMTTPTHSALTGSTARRCLPLTGAGLEGVPLSMHVGCITVAVGFGGGQDRGDAASTGGLYAPPRAGDASEGHHKGGVRSPAGQEASGQEASGHGASGHGASGRETSGRQARCAGPREPAARPQEGAIAAQGASVRPMHVVPLGPQSRNGVPPMLP